MFVLSTPFDKSGIDLNEITKGSDVRDIVEVLKRYKVEKHSIKTNNQMVQIGPLTEGVYLIEGVSEKGFDIAATLVSIPQWDNEGKKLSYNVTIIPKVQRLIEPVETGDATNLMLLSILCGLSLIVIVGISGRAYFLKDK